MAVNRLDGNDVAAVVIFDNTVDVLVAARAVTDPAHFTSLIRSVGVRGSTAIYDGVTVGASEVRKHKDARRLNRVVLLSDGLANVGPSRPEAFAALGRALLAEGISVSTIGLGRDYNEDLMLQLARASDGNHAFAGAPGDLIQIFNKEFDDVLASCAQTVSIDVDLKPGVRVVRALSRDGSIDGRRAKLQLAQIYAATEHYVLLELEFDGAAAGAAQDFGRVRVAYTVPETGAQRSIETAIGGRFSGSKEEATASLDRAVQEAVIEQTTRARAQAAILLRDQGKYEEAARLFRENAGQIESYLATAAKPSPVLQQLQSQYNSFADTAVAAPPAQWNVQRKLLRALDARSPGAGPRY
jgi:Ca-activated chloride channel family protein